MQSWGQRATVPVRALRKTLWIGLEIAAGIAAAMAVVLLLLWWFATAGPVSLGFLNNRIAALINAELDGVETRFSDAVIMREDSGAIRFRLLNVKLQTPQGKLLAGAPQASISFDPASILTGIAINRINLIGPVVTVNRGRDGRFRLGFANPDSKTKAGGTVKPAIAAAIDAKEDQDDTNKAGLGATPAKGEARSAPGSFMAGFFSGDRRHFLETLGIGESSNLKHVGIRNARLILFDEVGGKYWTALDVRLDFNWVPTGYTVSMASRFFLDESNMLLSLNAFYDRSSGAISVNSRFDGLVPAQFSSLIDDPVVRALDLPVTGEANISLDREGRIINGTADAEAGAGYVRQPDAGAPAILLDEARLKLTYDRETGIEINQAALFSGASYARFNGRIVRLRNDDGTFSGQWRMRLRSRDMGLALGNELKKALRFHAAALEAVFDPDPGRLTIERADLDSGKLAIRLNGALTRSTGSPAIKLAGVFRNISTGSLIQIWPDFAARGVREWMKKNILAGRVEKARFRLNIREGDLDRLENGRFLPDDRIRMTFSLRDVAFTYIDGLPPVTAARGEGVLGANSLVIRVKTGRVKAPSGKILKLSGGRFGIEDFSRDVTMGFTDGRITARLAGPTAAMLEILDMKPLEFISPMGIQPGRVGGTVKGQLNITLPLIRHLPLARVDIRATAELANTRIASVIRGMDLDGGRLKLVIDKKGLDASGPVRLNGIEAALTWRENFDAHKEISSRFNVTARLDDKQRRALGLSLDHLIRGPAIVKVEALGRGTGIRSVRIKADLGRAELRQRDIHWRKPPGKAATVGFDLDIGQRDRLTIRNLKLSGKEIDVRGSLHFGAGTRLQALDLVRVRLGPTNDFSIRGKRGKSGDLVLGVTGKTFDARPLLRSILGTGNGNGKPRQGTAGGGPAVVRLSGHVAAMLTHNGVLLHKTRVKLLMRKGRIEELELAGNFSSGKPFSMSIEPETGNGRRLLVRSQDAGSVLRAADFYSRVSGGAFVLTALMNGADDAGMEGKLTIRNFRIVGESVLQSLLENQAVRKKGVRVPPGNDVEFRKFKVRFKQGRGRFSFSKGLIAGPSIGATARGEVDKTNQVINMAGTLVPAYKMNTALGKIPLLGALLSGRKGEGIFGITFGIKGPMASPVLSINPVSALAPGILRRLFEFSGSKNDYSNEFDTERDNK